MITWPGKWSADDVLNHPDYCFLYGDNLMQVGYAGQACIRGLPNTHGIPTKRRPGMDDATDFFSDRYYDVCCAHIQQAFEDIPRGYLAYVVSEAGLGTGLAQLESRAPRVYGFLQQQLLKFEIEIDDEIIKD
jgi:hypothetical protein